MKLFEMLNMLVAFVIEIVMLVALAYGGAHVGHGGSAWRWVLGISAPLAAAVIWSVWGAPMSKRRLKDVNLLLFKLAMFGVTAAVIYATKNHGQAVAFLVVCYVSVALSFMWKQ